VAVAADGQTVYVADLNNHRIQAFDARGRFLGTWGSDGHDDGQFWYPYGVVVASDGQTIYVADTGNHRIQAFCRTPGAGGDGNLATPGASPVMSSPTVTSG
jgi:DNA-binding beta-propeller fold protein YncE